MPNQSAAGEQDTSRTTAASYAAYNLADSFMVLQPALLAHFVLVGGLSDSQAGMVASLEMIAIAFSMIAASRFFASPSYLKLSLVGWVVAIGSVAACFGANQLGEIGLILIVLGIGAGLLSVVPPMAISTLPNADRAFPRMYMISLVCNGALSALLPLLAPKLPVSPVFPVLIAYAVLLLPVMLLMPVNARAPDTRSAAGQARRNPLPGLTIMLYALGVSVLAVPFYGVWSFLVVLGQRAGLNPADANAIVTLSVAGAFAGSLTMTVFGRRLKNALPTYLGATGVGIGLTVMAGVTHPLALPIASFITLFALYLLLPAVLTSAAAIDPSGRGAAFVNASALLTGASGPYVVGGVLERYGLPSVAFLASAALLISLAALAGARRRSQDGFSSTAGREPPELGTGARVAKRR